MAWIESHQELGSHPKTRKLAHLLGVTKVQVVGHLHYFWWWAANYCNDGDLTRFDALDIALGGEWEGDPDVFVDALIRAGFVDDEGTGNRQIHDWDCYFGKMQERRARHAERMREARAEQKEGSAPHVSGTYQAREGLPYHTVPNQPNQTITPLPPKGGGVGFTSFWAVYPKRRGKADAEKAWRKLHPDDDLTRTIIASVRRSCKSREWLKDDGQFVPLPATYLNGRRWEDEEYEPPPHVCPEGQAWDDRYGRCIDADKVGLVL